MSYVASKSINRWRTSIYGSQHFSNISLTVKVWSTVDLPNWKPPRFLLLFLQHKVLLLCAKYLPKFYMLYKTMWLLYTYHTSHFLWIGQVMPYFHLYGMISSSLFNHYFGQNFIIPSCFSIFSFYLLPSLCLHHLVVQHMVPQFVHTLPTLLTITVFPSSSSKCFS